MTRVKFYSADSRYAAPALWNCRLIRSEISPKFGHGLDLLKNESLIALVVWSSDNGAAFHQYGGALWTHRVELGPLKHLELSLGREGSYERCGRSLPCSAKALDSREIKKIPAFAAENEDARHVTHRAQS
jgi:hypothetical protein